MSNSNNIPTQRCSICGEFDFGHHRCKPAWLAKLPDDENEDAVYVYADTIEKAAEAFMYKIMSDMDYPSRMEIWVSETAIREVQWQKFDVVVEMVPSLVVRTKEGE